MDRHGEPLLIGYERYLPQTWGTNEMFVLIIMLLGIASIILVEFLAKQQQ